MATTGAGSGGRKATLAFLDGDAVRVDRIVREPGDREGHQESECAERHVGARAVLDAVERGDEASDDQHGAEAREHHLLLVPALVVGEAGNLHSPRLVVEDEERADCAVGECDRDAVERIRTPRHDGQVGDDSHHDDECEADACAIDHRVDFFGVESFHFNFSVSFGEG
jgi:hypothetical protein